jgi:hypothetical protein
MQMWAGGVAGVAEQADHLTGPQPLPDPHANRSGLHVQVDAYVPGAILSTASLPA